MPFYKATQRKLRATKIASKGMIKNFVLYVYSNNKMLIVNEKPNFCPALKFSIFRKLIVPIQMEHFGVHHSQFLVNISKDVRPFKTRGFKKII